MLLYVVECIYNKTTKIMLIDKHKFYFDLYME